MSLSLYTLDIIRSDGSTHYTLNVLLTSDEAAKLTAWLNSVTSTHVGATSGTLTAASQPLPIRFDQVVRLLDQQIPMHGKPNLHPSLT